VLKPALNLPAIAEVYAVFEELTLAARAHFAGRAGGLLMLYALADDAGAAVALGSSIAGAASLGVDPDAEQLKLAVRNGVCDFSVNHLDEALRILKNEIRKKTPVSVGLVGDVGEWVAEMVARGVQPDFVASSVEERGIFVARGSRVLGDGWAASSELEEVWWSVGESPMRWLPVLDSMAAKSLKRDAQNAEALDDGVDERLRWSRAVPRYLVRVPEHYLKMSAVEAERFFSLIEAGRGSGAVPVLVTVRRRVRNGLVQVLEFDGR
jgi:Urocanase Rossmann-like domain